MTKRKSKVNRERAARSLQASGRLPDVIHFLKCRRDDAAHELQCFYAGDYIPEQNPFAQRERLERHAIMFSEAVKHLEQPNTNTMRDDFHNTGDTK